MPPMCKEVRWCDMCRQKGLSSKLRSYHINLTETVVMCSSSKCTYPLGYKSDAEQTKPTHAPSTALPTKRKSTAQHLPEETPKRTRFISVSAPASTCTSPARIESHSINPCTYTSNINHDPFGDIEILDLFTDDTSEIVQPKIDHKVPIVSNAQVLPVKTPVPAAHTTNGVHRRPELNAVQQMSPPPKILPNINNSAVKYLHWWNKDALCWLDVAMCMLVHSKTVRRLLVDVHTENNLAKRIVMAWDDAQRAVHQGVVSGRTTVSGSPGRTVRLETSVGQVTVKTGGGEVISSLTCPQRLAPSLHMISASAKVEPVKYSEGCGLLDAVREVVWQRLQPKLNCTRGDNDSPVFALPLLLRESAPLMQTFMVHYGWEMTCMQCAYQHTDSVTRCMPTFPNVTSDFTMTEGAFLRDCFMCPATQQRMCIKFKKMPPILMVHFMEGLPHSDYARYDFDYDGSRFAVTSVVQYHNNPAHFITWIRNPTHGTWMMVDDLEKKTTMFGPDPPTFPPSQVHIVMWERQCDEGPTEVLSRGQHGAATVTTVSMSRTPHPTITRVSQAPAMTNGFERAPVLTTTLSHISPAVKGPTQSSLATSGLNRLPASTGVPFRVSATNKAHLNPAPALTNGLGRIAPVGGKCVLPANWEPTMVTLPVSGKQVKVPFAMGHDATTPAARKKAPPLAVMPVKDGLPALGQSKLIDPGLVGVGVARPSQIMAPLGGTILRRNSVCSNRSSVPPCTDASLSRMERLRLNAERLKAQKAQQVQQTSSQSQRPAAVNTNKLPSGGIDVGNFRIPAVDHKTYLEALQPFMSKAPVNVVTKSKILGSGAAARFQAFSFNNTSRSQSCQSIALPNLSLLTAAKPSVKKDTKVKSIAAKPESVAAVETSAKMIGKKIRISRTSQKAGKLGEPQFGNLTLAKQSRPGMGCLAKGESKATLAIKNYIQANGGSECHVRGDPATCTAVKTASAGVIAKSSSRVSTMDAALVNHDFGPDAIPPSLDLGLGNIPPSLDLDLVAAPTSLGKTKTVGAVSEIPSPGLKSASVCNPDLVSATPDIGFGKTAGVELFNDMNFDANIDFANLDFNLDDFLI